MKKAKQILKFILNLKASYRKLILITIDIFILPLSILLTFYLWPQDLLNSSKFNFYWLIISSILVGIPLYIFSGKYQGLTRYANSSFLYKLSTVNGLLIFILFNLGKLLRLPIPQLQSWILIWILINTLTSVSRISMRDVLQRVKPSSTKKIYRSAIYGAGAAGAQLAISLKLEGRHDIKFFLDDDPNLWNRNLNGLQIFSPEILSRDKDNIDQILLAIPSLNNTGRRKIIESLQQKGIPVLQMPSIEELTSGKARMNLLRPIDIDDLLGRDPVPPDPQLLGPGIKNKIVCITGAGGSIGSELSRQLIKLKPKKIILVENSEINLYTIHKELLNYSKNKIAVVPMLGDATNLVFIDNLLKNQLVNVLFHAAAYKHVPLVEANPLQGLGNNVISTRVVCQAALENKLDKLILISSDKAVRPTNVMGASKRLAELIVQGFAEEVFQSKTSSEHETKFAMVRFGNVLGSSGSVVPLFRQQIASGGPITLTHPDMLRYFMTIPEAAQLVIQASVLAKGGDLFLLNMGDPIKIKHLAEQMVRLSGLSIKNEKDPHGDIEIITTGLRSGEKLHEELLIDAESQPTKHPLIFRAAERSIPFKELWPKLNELEKNLKNLERNKSLDLLYSLVPEWKRQSHNH
tara:strand:- start:4964 stop:6865 length:1902 start_codon:yes stop_codon:yes gene_type:complete